MKLAELKLNTSKMEQYNRIIEHPKAKLLDVIQNPSLVRMKVLCFIGNYAGFATNGLTVRKFIYNFEEKAWIISDLDMSDGFEEFYDHHFRKDEMEGEFGEMFDREGFLLDID